MARGGFPEEAWQFFDGLAVDNSRGYWQANRDAYERAVRGSMLELLAELDEFGPFHIFRPYRDVRFSKDKTPYKDHIGAFGESPGGAGFYVQFSAAGMVAGSGYYHFASDQLGRFRAAVDDATTGVDLEARCRAAERDGLRLASIGELKTAPRGVAKDHPRIALLRRKGLVTMREWLPARWMRSAQVNDRVRQVWTAGADVNAWLDAHVGPSTLPPDDTR